MEGGFYVQLRSMLEDIHRQVKEMRMEICSLRTIPESLEREESLAQDEQKLVDVAGAGGGKTGELEKENMSFKTSRSVGIKILSREEDKKFVGGQGGEQYSETQHNCLLLYAFERNFAVLGQGPGYKPDVGGICFLLLRKNLLYKTGFCNRGWKGKGVSGLWMGRKVKIKSVLLLVKTFCPDPGGGKGGSGRRYETTYGWEGRVRV